MQVLITKARLIACFFILVGFFIPAYKGISGFSFIPLVFRTLEETSELTIVDGMVAIIPLVGIPLSTLAILFRTYQRKSTRKTYRALPLICVFAFSVILVMSLKSISGSGMNSLKTFFQIGGGYYIVVLFSLILPFTRSPFRKKVKQQSVLDPEMAL